MATAPTWSELPTAVGVRAVRQVTGVETPPHLGVVTLRGALERGMTPAEVGWAVTSGRWQRVHRGVFVTHNGPLPWLTRAGCALAAGSAGAGDLTVALCGLSAAYAAGLTLGRLTAAGAAHPDGPPITLLVARQVRVTRPDGVTIFRSDRHRVDATTWPPRTTPSATLLYLARQARADDVVGALAAAVQGGWIDPAAMLAELDTFGRHRHRHVLREALTLAAGGAESVVEVRYARDVERRHRLPHGVRQLARRLARHDVGYREHRVLVELDGRLAHGGVAFVADRRRDNAAVLEGYVVLRFAGLDVMRNPCAVAADVAEALTRRGWAGPPRICGPACSVGRRGGQDAAIGW
jgi:very-short-patch-repair endonuclease